VSTDESIAWLEAAIAYEGAVAASWSLFGWPRWPARVLQK
jgi:hypothetical protein